jgi:phosphopantetheine adenylyltransferase
MQRNYNHQIKRELENVLLMADEQSNFIPY